MLPIQLIVDRSEQGTPEWHAARSGLITGSRLCDVLAESKPDKSGKTRPLKAREDYLYDLATEIAYGRPKDTIDAPSLRWGKDVEPYARTSYEAETGKLIVECGFIKNVALPGIGVSVDGLIEDDGTYESKCPKDSRVHTLTWLFGMPEEHMPQVQGGLWVTGRQWCDFVSFDPRAKPEMQLYVQRIHRNDIFIADMAAKVASFKSELDRIVAQLQVKIGVAS